MEQKKVPKVIHLCTFCRGRKSHLIEHWIGSWRRIMPDYEIIGWNEDNFGINMNTKES